MKIVTPDYTYSAIVTSIHDGDTCRLDVDLNQRINLIDRDFGFHFYVQVQRLRVHEDFRFFGINAPELATPEGKTALAFLKTMIQVGSTVRAQINKSPSQEKYGRWLATLFLPDGTNVNQKMIDSGNAVPYLMS